MSAFRPWCNVVCMHLFNFKIFSAFYTDTVLTFIHFSFYVVIKFADIQMAFITIKHIFVYA